MANINRSRQERRENAENESAENAENAEDVVTAHAVIPHLAENAAEKAAIKELKIAKLKMDKVMRLSDIRSHVYYAEGATQSNDTVCVDIIGVAVIARSAGIDDWAAAEGVCLSRAPGRLMLPAVCLSVGGASLPLLSFSLHCSLLVHAALGLAGMPNAYLLCARWQDGWECYPPRA